MRRASRLLSVAAAAVGLSLAATACDSSPTAATIGGQVIKQAALNNELRTWSANHIYVSVYDQTPVNQQQGNTVVGQGPSTYSSQWVADILRGMIVAAAVHQHLLAANSLPSNDLLAATRPVAEIAYSYIQPGQPDAGWLAYPPAFREVLVERLAELAAISPTPVLSASDLQSVYNSYKPYFFTEVCVAQASAASSAEAHADATSGIPAATTTCYDQPTFATQPNQWQQAVLPTATGKVAPILQTANGYEVLKVVSRMGLGLTPDVQQVLSAAVVTAQGARNNDLNTVLGGAKIRVSPQYGTWKSPFVVPPTAPVRGS